MLSVKWGHAVSNCFTVRNRVKQGGILSPLLFAIYTDSLLKILEESGVECHMGRLELWHMWTISHCYL